MTQPLSIVDGTVLATLRFPAAGDTVPVDYGAYAHPYGGRLANITTLATELAPLEVVASAAWGDLTNYNRIAMIGVEIFEGVGAAMNAGFFDYFPPIWRFESLGNVAGNPAFTGNNHQVVQIQARSTWCPVLMPARLAIVVPDQWFGLIDYNIRITAMTVPADIGLRVFELIPPQRQRRFVDAGIAAAATVPAAPESFHPLGAGIAIVDGAPAAPVSAGIKFGLSGPGWQPFSLQVRKLDTTDDISVIARFMLPNQAALAAPAVDARLQETQFGVGSGGGSVSIDPEAYGSVFILNNAVGVTAGEVVLTWTGP